MTPAGFRTVQVFLSQAGTVNEVSLELASPPKALHCTCGAFAVKKRCRHGDYVRKRMASNNGRYRVEVASSVPDEVIEKAAVSSPEAFREFVLRYAKVEYL